MKQWLVKNNFMKTMFTFAIFAILIVGISFYLIYDQMWIGPAYLAIGVLGLFTLRIADVDLKSVYPDIMFGVIDNGILIFTTVLGGQFAGVAGAVLGGAAGNTLTDGFGGIIEGKIAEKLKRDHYKEERNAFTSMLGKTVGCLLGAGIGLIIVFLLSFFWINLLH